MKLLGTLGIIVVICGVLLGASFPALADGPGMGEKGPWWEGKIEVVRGQASINPGSVPPGATGVINVNSRRIYVTADTVYKVPGPETAGISDIDGKYIATQCDIAATELWARYVIAIPGRSEGGEPEYGYRHYAGRVTAYDYEPTVGGTIAIRDKPGSQISFRINGGDFRIMPPDATVAVAEWVTVISYRDGPAAQPVAAWVVVHSQKSPSFSHGGLSHARWTEEERAARNSERTRPEAWR